MIGSDEAYLLSQFPFDFKCDRGGIRYTTKERAPMPKTYKENFQDALDTVLGMRRMAENAWEEEQLEAAHAVLELQAEAYDKAFTDCEEQDSGFAGSTSWTNSNPYRKTL